MIAYRVTLDEIPNEDFTQTISAGMCSLTFHFRWDTANQEQYDIYRRALDARASADPLLKGTSIIREYDWIEWYTLLPADIQAALEEGMEYPQSLRKLADNFELMATQLEERKIEALALKKLITPLEEQLVWSVEITDASELRKTGVVRPGGWIGNQDQDWRVQFVSDLENIGYNDLLKMIIRMEVTE